VHLASYYQETGTSPGELLDPSATGRKQAVDVFFDRAVARGEITGGHLTERVKALPFDLLRHAFMTTFVPVPDQVLEEIVDTIFLPLLRLAG
jgi:Tetracyclin repressor-like, C-terminal domain